MHKWDTVTIVGVGLIGGSIGLALRRRELARRVIGVGRRSQSLRAARRVGAVTSTTLDLARGVSRAELIVVCTPVAQIVGYVRAAAQSCPEEALITDVGSTKQEIVATLNGTLERNVRFVGSHPIAGSEKSGPEKAQADLFVNRAVIVTPTPSTSVEDCRGLEEFWSSLGARVLCMPADEHDRALAATSHVPHLVASALAAATPRQLAPLTAGGWHDTTRVAAGEPELWTQILLENRGNVCDALARFEKVVHSFRDALQRRDRAKLKKILAQGKLHRDAVGS